MHTFLNMLYARMFCYTIFIASILLYNYLNIFIGRLDGSTTHLIFLHNLHKIKQPRASEKQIFCILYPLLVPLWIVYSQPLLSALGPSSSFPHLLPRMTFFRAPNR